MNLSRVFPLIVACGLQLMPVARVVSNAVLPSSTFAIVFKWAAGAVALLGSFHAVSGASAKITGMVKYVGTTPVGSPTNNAVEPVNEPFKYRITVANAGSDHKKDYFNCIPVPPGLTINTNIGGTGYITGTPTTVGVYPVTLYAGNTSYPKPVTYDATITITAVNDSLDESDPHAGTISHSASGGGYTGVSISSVTVKFTFAPSLTV